MGEGVLVESRCFPGHLGPFEVVVANWTLHFIKERKAYLHDVYNNLAPEGLLILTEKTVQSDLAKDLYHSWKRAHGVSLAEIADKAARLDGVLMPFPLTWYFDVLTELGFCDVGACTLCMDL